MIGGAAILWRVFPWDPDAPEGGPFSRSYTPTGQGSGRFDLPGRPRGVVYLAESPEHAIAELIQGFRGMTIDGSDLMRGGHPLALVSVGLRESVLGGILDLCDPAELARLGIGPDEVAARDRATTQAIAARAFALGHTGLRWWSAFFGEWRSVVLFLDRSEAGRAVYGAPEPLELTHPALRTAAELIGVGLPRR